MITIKEKLKQILEINQAISCNTGKHNFNIILLAQLSKVTLVNIRSTLSLCRTIVFEHVLNDISYTILLYIYGYILITWYTMYAEISYYLSNQNNNENNQKNESNPLIYKHYKKVVKLRLFLVLLIQIAVSIFTGLRLEIDYPHFAMICYSFLLINFFIFIFEFALKFIKIIFQFIIYYVYMGQNYKIVYVSNLSNFNKKKKRKQRI